ncbi:MAG TPA: PilZ domain-containing protein [Vicinamibacterales bacterium]|nr:PilZ domain-containing protein [Vicinamibacterales bacterium]
MFGRDRRQHARTTHYCEAVIEGLDAGRAACRVADIGLGGVFVEARTVLPPGTSALVRFGLVGRELSIPVEVRYSQTGYGMGLRFTRLSQQDEAAIRAFLLTRAAGQ